MKTLIDVTHILGWQGNLTGIERVELNLIQYYIDHTDAQFVIWNMSLKRWLRLKDKKVASLLKGHSANSSTASDSQANRLTEVSKIIMGKIKRLGDYQKIEIEEGDKLIIPAGLWDNHGYIEGLSILAKNGVRIVHVIHDMIPVVEPQLVLGFMPKIFRNYMLKVLPLCELILCVSEASAKDTRKFLESNKKKTPKIKTFRLGDDMLVNPSKQAFINETQPFCLMVGTVEIRKNHMLLYYVYKKAALEGIDLPNLVIVGKKGWLTDGAQHLLKKDPDVKGKVIMTGAISDQKLARLYEKAAYTIVPSLYEGWGLQVSESLARGTIVLATNISSVPEVGGDCCDYFSPYSPDEVLKLMQRYNSAKERSKRKSEIMKRYKRHEWGEAASKFAKLADSL